MYVIHLYVARDYTKFEQGMAKKSNSAFQTGGQMNYLGKLSNRRENKDISAS